jgi:hypothetical protein
MNYRNIYELFLENKDRFIDKNKNLDPMQKQIAKDFFKGHPASESQVDWNKSATLTYKDFEKIFDDANNTKHAMKKASKENPRLLFEKRDDCKVVGENDKFIFVMPLNYKACVWMDSFDCGGGGAKWCIGYEEDDSYYEQYTKSGYSFVLAFNKYPTDINNDLKYMIQVDPIKLENDEISDAGKCWTQDDDRYKTYKLTSEESDRNVENLTGITKDQLITYGYGCTSKEEREKKVAKRIGRMTKMSYCEVEYNNLQKTIDDADTGLIIRILDPENVVLGDYREGNTLSSIIFNNSNIKLDFSPSDFSDSKLIDDTSHMFFGCSNLIKMCKLPSSISDANSLFYGCDSLVSVDTSNFISVKDASYMFSCCQRLESIDTAAFKSVEKATCMFTNCDISTIDTSAFINVTDTSCMFSNCASLVSIDTSVFKNVKSANGMFSSCRQLSSIGVPNFINAIDIESMFKDCVSLVSIDLGSFKNVTSAFRVFLNCKKLESVYNYPFAYSTEIREMFEGCESLKEIKFKLRLDYLDGYSRLIMSANNDARLSKEQRETAMIYSSSPIICFKRD